MGVGEEEPQDTPPTPQSNARSVVAAPIDLEVWRRGRTEKRGREGLRAPPRTPHHPTPPRTIHTPHPERLRVERLVPEARGVAAARLSGLGGVHGEAQPCRVHIVPERLHARLEAHTVSAQLVRDGVAARLLLLPTVCGGWWSVSEGAPAHQQPLRSPPSPPPSQQRTVHVHARIPRSGEPRRHEAVRDPLVECLADALGGRLVRAVVRGRREVAPEDLP